MSLELLESEDRGFLTWVATMARVPLPTLWVRLLAQGDTALTAAGVQLERLDLSILGSVLRDKVGPTRRLSLPVGGLDALVALDCSGLSLDQLDLRPLPQLRELRCVGNRLVTLELSPSLEILDARSNRLDVLDLRGLTRLVRIDVRDNPLKDLLLGDHPALEQLLRDS